ncbi:DUF3322 domain-containing protein [Actinomadura viridis]|uniref:DUF3322 domain-containing protein n=1 Tax=Actinomadura viridis TaxID=58110 RepID=UPI003680B5EA
MRDPDDVLAQLCRRFDRDYPAWARGEGTWPMSIGLKPPSTRQRSADPVACHTWAERWNDYTGPGHLTYTRSRFPTGIVHAMPSTLTIQRPSDAAAASPRTRQTWQRCGRRLTELQSAFPAARLHHIVRKVTDLDGGDYQRLVNAVTWLQANPTSGLLLRQLPIEGIDTKWLTRHTTLVLALLPPSDGTGQPSADSSPPPPPQPPGPPDSLDEAGAQAPASARRRLHQRLGLRIPPELIQVNVLDPALRTQLAGMRHLAASIDDLNRWPHHPHTVVLLENTETGYAITDDHPGVVVLHGQGFAVAHYARITWVRRARTVVYWGDIDAPGLQFVSDLRRQGINARTILMDMPTLGRFRHLTVEGSGPRRADLHHLTASEQALYRHLCEHAATHGGLLLEQERILWDHARPVLTAAMSAPGHQPGDDPLPLPHRCEATIVPPLHDAARALRS